MTVKLRLKFQALCKYLGIHAVSFGDKSILSALVEKGFSPEECVCHYIEYALPSVDLKDDGFVILGALNFLEKNTEFSPAIFIRELGFWTIATFYDGGAYVIDVCTGCIILVDPGQYYYENGIALALGENGGETITREFILRTSETQAGSLEEFVEDVIAVVRSKG